MEGQDWQDLMREQFKIMDELVSESTGIPVKLHRIFSKEEQDFFSLLEELDAGLAVDLVRALSPEEKQGFDTFLLPSAPEVVVIDDEVGESDHGSRSTEHRTCSFVQFIAAMFTGTFVIWKKGFQLTLVYAPYLSSVNAFEPEPDQPEAESPCTNSASVLFKYWNKLAPAPPGCIQGKINALLLSVEFWSDNILLQFWAPAKTSSTTGSILLTVVDQPCAIGHPYYYGLCAYRKLCLDNVYCVWEAGEGPPGRVFRHGSPEYCPNIECYSKEEFPGRDYAIEVGIVGYWALPVFEQQLDHDGPQQQQCVGVIEYVSLSRGTNVVHHVNRIFPPFEDLHLTSQSSHFHKCNKIREDLLSPRGDIKSALKFVREAHNLPLIQLWVPCMCDSPDASVECDESSYSFSNAASKTTELFCDMRCCSRIIEYFSEFEEFNRKYGTCSVKNGKDWVGRAYSQKKSCYFRDSSQFSISDYPLVHLTRSSGLASCFAIPLQFIHPMLDAFLLEIFLPPEQNNSELYLEAVLKSLLSTVAEGFSKLNIALGLQQGEEFWVEFTYLDDQRFNYFDIHRSGRNLNNPQDLGSEREEWQFSLSHQSPNLKVSDHPNRQDRAKTSRGVSANAEAQITSDVIKSYVGGQHEVAAENVGGYQVQSRKTSGSDTEEQQFRASNQSPTLEASVGNYESNATARKEHSGLTDNPNTQDQANTFGRIFRNVAVNITLDDLEPYFGRKIEVAAENFGVSRSTLKRWCRQFGIKRWPSHPRNKLKYIQSNPRLPNRSVEDGGEVIREPEIGRCESNNALENEAGAASSIPKSAKHKIIATGDEIAHGNTMIIKATHRDDTAMFPLCHNSGFEDLCCALAKRFKLKVENFKIKYVDDNDWILMSCDEDLHFRMDALKSAGQTRMNLSIFTAS